MIIVNAWYAGEKGGGGGVGESGLGKCSVDGGDGKRLLFKLSLNRFLKTLT